MALVLANRVQESATANTTVSFTLTGAVAGFQTFAVIGNTNTTYYSSTDTAGNWEVGLGTYSTSGPTLTRTTIYASSNGGSAETFVDPVSVFVTYPSGKSVNLDASGNASALGTIASGTWQGSTIGVAYGGTGVTASSGANSVMLRDANQNVAVNRLNQSNTNTAAAGGTTALTAASSYVHTLTGTGSQTYTMPDATTLTTGVDFIFNNVATGTLTIQNYATGSIGTIPAGGAGAVFLIDNGTVGGTWDIHAYLPEGVTFGTNAFNLGSTIVTGGTWNGGTIQPAYGGTGLTTFTGANNALFSTGATTLTAGTLPVAAGGTGATTSTGSGAVVLASSPALTTPNIGTPSAGTLTSCTGLPLSTGVTGTLPVANGGTGAVSQTAYAVLCGGTTSTGAFQSIAGVGTSGQILTSNGAGALPTFQAAGGGFTAGTAMMFVQTAAPTGWTKSTAHDNKALRVVSGSASSGGTTGFSTVFSNQTPTISNTFGVGATTLSTSQIPSHTHTVNGVQFAGGATNGIQTTRNDGDVATPNVTSSATGGGGSHTHSISGSATSSAITLNVQYVDVIIATKD